MNVAHLYKLQRKATALDGIRLQAVLGECTRSHQFRRIVSNN